MIEAMTEAELYALSSGTTAPPVTRTSSITSPQEGIAKITINRPQVRNAFRPVP